MNEDLKTGLDLDALERQIKAALEVSDSGWIDVNGDDVLAIIQRLREAEAERDRFKATLVAITDADTDRDYGSVGAGYDIAWDALAVAEAS